MLGVTVLYFFLTLWISVEMILDMSQFSSYLKNVAFSKNTKIHHNRVVEPCAISKTAPDVVKEGKPCLTEFGGNIVCGPQYPATQSSNIAFRLPVH